MFVYLKSNIRIYKNTFEHKFLCVGNTEKRGVAWSDILSGEFDNSTKCKHRL